VSNCHFASSANFLLALHTFIDFFSTVKKADHEIVIHPLTTLMPRTQLPRRHTARRRGAASGSRPSLPGAMDMRTVVLEASSHDAAKQFWGQRRAVSFTIGMLIGVALPLTASAALSSASIFRGHRSDARAYLHENRAQGQTAEQIASTFRCWDNSSMQVIHTCDSVEMDTNFGPLTVGGGMWYTLTHNTGVILVASGVTWLLYNFLFQVVWKTYMDAKLQMVIDAVLERMQNQSLQASTSSQDVAGMTEAQEAESRHRTLQTMLDFTDTLTEKAMEVQCSNP
jgi:hypothetical protein